MATKQETLDNIISHQTYVGSAVKRMITDISTEAKIVSSTYKKGDVFRVQGGNFKLRPAVCIKVTKTYLIAIPLTSKDSEHCLSESVSRFWAEGCFCNQYSIIPI